MLNRIWTRATTGVTAAAIAASGFLALPQDAQAQDKPQAPVIGQCVTPVEISGQLKGQEQKMVFSAMKNGTFVNSEKKDYAFKLVADFTSTPDGKSGYLLQQCNDDKGKANGLIKADQQVTNIRVFPDTYTAPTDEMKVSTPKSLADQACKAWNRATCKYHNDYLTGLYASGGKLVYQSFSPEKGQLINLSYHPSTKDGLITITDAKTGANTVLTDIANGDYSKFAKEIGKTIPLNIAALPQSPVAAFIPKP